MKTWLAFVLAVLSPLAAHAAAPLDPVQTVLLGAATPEAVRSGLLSLASTTPRPREAAVALYERGLSFERGTLGDSAIASYRRSFDLHPTRATGEALIEALLRRRSANDVQEVIRLLEGAATGDDPAVDEALADPARLAWAYVLAGNARHGLDLVKSQEPQLAEDPHWRFRLARMHLDAGDPSGARRYLTELAVASRGHDPDAMAMLKGVDRAMGPAAKVREGVERMISDRNRLEGETLARWNGRLVRFAASDGSTVGTSLIADSAARRPARAVVVLRGLDDNLSDYDSLVAALRAKGHAVMLVDPRGTGWSVDRSVPLPDTWEGREEALEDRVGRDLQDALGVFARLARIDTTRFVAVGVGAMAPVVVDVADRDPRVAAVALVDPWVSSVERGAVLAHARASGLPAYVQLGFADARDIAYADTLRRSFDERSSRKVEAGSIGQGAAQFGTRADLRAAFVQWVGEPRPSRATRRPPRRPR